MTIFLRTLEKGGYEEVEVNLLLSVVAVLVCNILACEYFLVRNVLNLFFFFHQISQNKHPGAKNVPSGFMTNRDCLSWSSNKVLGHAQFRNIMFTTKINSDAFVFVLRDIPQVLPQSTTYSIDVIYSDV